MAFPVPGSNWDYTRSYFVYKPSDDASGETDANAINGLWAQGKAVLLIPGQFYSINQPLIPVTGSFMTGLNWWSASAYDSYGAGTGQPGGSVLQMTDTFAGNYAINMFNASASQYYGVDLSGFTIDGQVAASGGGILADGAWGACFLRGVAILQTPGDCLHFAADDTTGKVPDDWQVTSCKFSGGGGGGVYADDIPDSWFDDNEASGNAAHNWDINFSINTRLANCKGEGSVNGAGFRFGGNGTGDVVTLTACTTQYNQLDGFLFDNTAGGSAQSVYQLANCVSTHDNQIGTTPYSGFRSNGCLGRVMGSNCVAIGATYGAYQGSDSYFMCFTGSYLSGTTSATHDDGTNTHALVNQSPVGF